MNAELREAVDVGELLIEAECIYNTASSIEASPVGIRAVVEYLTRALGTAQEGWRAPEVALEQVVQFLLGEDEIDCHWFGETPKGKGSYWWRHPLREAWNNRHASDGLSVTLPRDVSRYNAHVAKALLRELTACVQAAIKAGDWKVDGACDPEATLTRITVHLGGENNG